MVTSFSSKSELALNLSTDGKYLTFMGYVAPIDAIDVSNSNTPGVVDPTNPVGENAYRAVAQVDAKGNFQFTETNAYSGNNGRAAILNNRRRRECSLHGRQRRQRRQSPAGRYHPRRGRADLDPESRPKSRRTRETDAGGELQHHPAGRHARTRSAKTTTSAG